eukprot:Unigene5076_Nuclearia_a/m.15566 Unigene5076_Nuclearia_a/g.15566  ORF Unigene5076_Nuclearia_a/g.15566 Unigene5076_Nuclearia_a/m.15566 type:complete len:290 (+) Unigene5076_Nuclearia_a:1516-2385(+)
MRAAGPRVPVSRRKGAAAPRGRGVPLRVAQLCLLPGATAQVQVLGQVDGAAHRGHGARAAAEDRRPLHVEQGHDVHAQHLLRQPLPRALRRHDRQQPVHGRRLPCFVQGVVVLLLGQERGHGRCQERPVRTPGVAHPIAHRHVTTDRGEDVARFFGKWHESLQREVDADRFQFLWRAHPPLPNAVEQYGFTRFAIELNEITDDLRDFLPPTDSRLRPDQRMLEEGRVEQAEAEKARLEDKQRVWRREMEAARQTWQPRWFEQRDGEFRYKGGYWEAREARQLRALPLIF